MFLVFVWLVVKIAVLCLELGTTSNHIRRQMASVQLSPARMTEPRMTEPRRMTEPFMYCLHNSSHQVQSLRVQGAAGAEATQATSSKLQASWRVTIESRQDTSDTLLRRSEGLPPEADRSRCSACAPAGKKEKARTEKHRAAASRDATQKFERGRPEEALIKRIPEQLPENARLPPWSYQQTLSRMSQTLIDTRTWSPWRRRR